LGWTHACGSGESIARIVSGLQPEVNFAFAGMPKGSGAVTALAAPLH
ncbi:MAG: amino acid dehydrogenase, partial [Betaproteobacteria bacterium]